MPVADPLYPVNLVVAGKRCLVVGGGAIAAGKAQALLACGASVHVVAPLVATALRELDGVEIDERPFAPGDVAGHALVIAATDDPDVNRAVFAESEARGIWVNSVDDPDNCTFTTPAQVRQGDLLVTVSTGGHSPALASWLRRRFEQELGPEYATLLDILSEERAALRAAGRSTEGLDWQAALESGMLDLVREGRLAEAKERLQACLSSSSG
jgi:precorrin-2 dehydrogenase/sirohydrochlorin ferrochelatase